MILPTLAGLFQGRANSQAQQQAQQQQGQALGQQNLMEAIRTAMASGQQLQSDAQGRYQAMAGANPLGAEQQFLQRQRLAQAILPQIANFQSASPTDPRIAAAYRPSSPLAQQTAGNPAFQATFGDNITANSIADRRRNLAQINPEFHFSSMGNMGLDPRFDTGINFQQQDALARLRGHEGTQSNLASQGLNLAQQQLQQAQQQPRGNSVWNNILPLLLGVGGTLAFQHFMNRGGSNNVTGGAPMGPPIPTIAEGFEGNDFTIPGMGGIDTTPPTAPMNFGQQVYSQPAGPPAPRAFTMPTGRPQPPPAFVGPPAPSGTATTSGPMGLTSIGPNPRANQMREMFNNFTSSLWEQPAVRAAQTPLGAMIIGGGVGAGANLAARQVGNLQQAVANIMRALRTLPPADAAKLLAHPQVQQILQAIR